MNGLSKQQHSTTLPQAFPITTTLAAVLVPILILAGVLRLMSLDFGLPHRYHIDEPAYVIAALKIGQGNLQLNYPPMSPSFQQLIYLALYGVYFLVQLALGQVNSPQEFAGLYKLDPTPFYLLARGVSVVSSLLAIIFLFLIVRRIRDNVTALIAALFLSVSFLDVRHAHFAEPYSLLGLLGLLTTFLALKYFDRGSWKFLFLSGFVSGMAIGIRFSLATLTIIPLLAVGYRCFALTPRCRPVLLFARLGLLAASLSLGFLVGVPGFLVNFQNTLTSLRNQTSLATGTDGFLGMVFSTLPSWKFYALMFEIAWGIPILIVLIFGLARFVWRHEPEETLFAVFPVTYLAVLFNASAASSAFARYLIPVLPFLAYLAADGLVWVINWGFRGWSLAPRQLFLATATVILMIIPLLRSIRLDILWRQPDTRTLALEWIEANIPTGARLAVQWYGPPLSTPDNPEPGTTQSYTVTMLYPFSREPERYSLDYYRKNGFDYLIISSHVYKLPFVDEALNNARMNFYLDLLASSRLVAEFKPYDGEREPAYIFEQMWGPIVSLYELDRPGPTIKIFALK